MNVKAPPTEFVNGRTDRCSDTVVVSGIAVMMFKSPFPDLLVGLMVVGIVLKGGWEILQQASKARRAADTGADRREVRNGRSRSSTRQRPTG